MAKLINGNGNPAIYAAQDADLIASLAGNVTCVANVGNKYAATEEDANTIGLADGVIITKEGRRIQLDAGETDLFAIPTGSSGVTNYYIIGYKLVQNADSSQVAEKFVQKMSSSSETITENTFRGGATEVYVSLYRVTQVGFNITAVDGLLPTLLDNSAIKNDITQINSDLTDLSSYGTNQNVSNNIAQSAGFTPSVDGILTFYMHPADTNLGYVEYTSSDPNEMPLGNSFMSQASEGGYMMVSTRPVKAGNTYKRKTASNCSVSVIFTPLHA